MFISKIQINNFRNFKSQEVLFNNGVNVIIGHNNAGKTNLLKALALVIDPEGKKRLDVHDFNKYVKIQELKKSPPAISITVTISSGSDEPDDLGMIGTWITKPDKDFEAKLTYEFSLPEAEHNAYKEAVGEIKDDEPDPEIKVWNTLQHDFIRHYKYRLIGGEPSSQMTADWEMVKKFDFQFLDAIRDVERDMHTGRNALLREVLDFFMDYEIKSMPVATHAKEVKEQQIRAKRRDFLEKSAELMTLLKLRMASGKVHILSYAHSTGASFDGAKPDFDGTISDIELFSALRLIVLHTTGIKVPATHNGLGYNNLIFMSLLLAKMQMNSDSDYMGGNSKVFAALAIEEPEAHLHPSMQYKFLKFLRENRQQKKVRQIFVTTHSAHITSAVSLDEIICINSHNGIVNIGYPGKVFPVDGKSKMYVQRFLDATKSEMLFAKAIIFVEGIAEQMLMSVFAQYNGKSLEDNQIAVVNVGGRYFEHFLHLFRKQNAFTIHKKIACITDQDPERKIGDKFKKCYPFEVFPGVGEYQFNSVARKVTEEDIGYFSQDIKFGKTFEYDLVLHNPNLKILLTESISNRAELVKIIDLHEKNSTLEKILEELRDSKTNDDLILAINAQDKWSEDEKKSAVIAARYLNSVGKGENALELSNALQINLTLDASVREVFKVPPYLTNAIDWTIS